MKNNGNTCYMISAINALNSCKSFSSLNLNDEVFKNIISENPDKVIELLNIERGQQDAEEIITDVIFKHLENITKVETKHNFTNAEKHIINLYNNYNIHRVIINILSMDDILPRIKFLGNLLLQDKLKDNILITSPLDNFKISCIYFDDLLATSFVKSFVYYFHIKLNYKSLNEALTNNKMDTIVFYPKLLLLKPDAEHNFMIDKEINFNNRHYQLKSCIYYSGNGKSGHYISICLRDNKFLLINDDRELEYRFNITYQLRDFKNVLCMYELL